MPFRRSALSFNLMIYTSRPIGKYMSADLQSSSFITIGVHATMVQETIQSQVVV